MPIVATQHPLFFLPQQYQRDYDKSLSFLKCTPVPNFLLYVSLFLLSLVIQVVPSVFSFFWRSRYTCPLNCVFWKLTVHITVILLCRNTFFHLFFLVNYCKISKIGKVCDVLYHHVSCVIAVSHQLYVDSPYVTLLTYVCLSFVLYLDYFPSPWLLAKAPRKTSKDNVSQPSDPSEAHIIKASTGR